MDNDKTEKSIRGAFQSLPRKNVEQGSKAAVWSLVQDHMRDSRVTAPSPVRQTPSRFIFGLRLSRVTVTAFSIVLAVIFVGTAARAAKGSLPGETLYNVKIASEYVEKVLATSDEKKVKVFKKHAESRLGEIQTLVTESASEELVTKTLENLKSKTEALHAATESASEQNPELIDGIVELAVEQEEVLAQVGEEVEGEVKDAVEDILTASRESVAQLQAGQEEVEGATEIDNPTEEAVKPAVPTVTEEEIKDTIESPVQTHGVIKSNPDEEEDDNEPKILPEPDFSF